MHNDTASRLRVAFRQMYAHSHNDGCIFELYQEISRASQEALKLSVADLSRIYILARPLSDFRFSLDWIRESGKCEFDSPFD